MGDRRRYLADLEARNTPYRTEDAQYSAEHIRDSNDHPELYRNGASGTLYQDEAGEFVLVTNVGPAEGYGWPDAVPVGKVRIYEPTGISDRAEQAAADETSEDPEGWA